MKSPTPNAVLDNCEPFGESSMEEPQPSGPAPRSLEGRLARFADLTEQKRRLESELRTVQDELTRMEQDLLEDMTLAGMSSAKVNGFQLFKAREFFARGKEGVSKQRMLEVLTNLGLDYCATVAHQSMRSLAREWSEAGEKPPAELLEVLDIGDTFRLRARKG